MRITLRSFAALDILSLVFLGMQLWVKVENYAYLSTAKLSEKIQAILLLPIFIIMAIGVIGLISGKKFGLILYYIQFPFRLYLYIFSVGFITFIPEALGLFEDVWFDSLLKLCFVAEFIRLYLTVKIQLSLPE